jgi:CPA2 family monovalent cation:H+ antiporter-2
MEHLLLILIATIFISTILNVLLKKLDIPTIIGYIFAGLIVNYSFGLMDINKDGLSHIAEFGIVFLMFTIGLEFSITLLNNMKKEVFVFGTFQVVIIGFMFTSIAIYALNIETKSAIIMGFALSLSSTAIVLKMLNEKNEIHSGYGRVTLGILLFEDLAVIPMLLMISIFTTEGVSVGELLLNTLGSAVIVFFILFVGGKMMLNRFFNWVTSSNSEEIFLVSVLFVVMSASFIAELFGFSYSLGAFLAGMTIAETKYKYRIESDLIPFRDILLGVFFVTIGMQIDLSIILTYGHIIIGLLVGVLILKALILYMLLLPFIQKRTALKTALALFQVGEFSLAIFALANHNGLLDDVTNQILIIMVVLSMIITPFILKNLKNISEFLFKEPKINDAFVSSGYKNHILICGYGSLGQKIVKKLKAKGLSYLILEHEKELVDEGEKDGEPIYLANAMQRDTLKAFDIKEALAVIVTIENTLKLRLTCEAIQAVAPNVNTVVKVKNRSHKNIIESFDINHIVNESEEMAELLSREVLNCRI